MKRPLAVAALLLAGCAAPNLNNSPTSSTEPVAAPVLSDRPNHPSRYLLRPPIARPAAPVPVKEPRRKLTKTQPLPVGPINWDAIAKCESGGHWHHHSPTAGLYWGGLQMTLRGWHSYHGDRYAPRPDLASKADQILVAEHWLRAQGWGAWPTCGRFR